jgi:D-amino-acid oxidase
MTRSQNVLVIGAGVSGLTTALALADSAKVTIVAERPPEETVSTVAGALWEWPPAVCGHHRDQGSLARSKQWCMVSYAIFRDLARDPAETGVHMRVANFYFSHRVEDNPVELTKMTELSRRVDGFRHDPALITENGVNRDYDPDHPVVDAYQYLAPMIDTDRYLGWLLGQVEKRGVKVLVGHRITGLLAPQEEALRAQYGVDVIVNCSGLGSAELAEAAMVPLRGALVRARNDGRRVPRVDQAHCLAHHPDSGIQDMVFIVPRGADLLLLGGLVEPMQLETDIGLDYPPVVTMRERCLRFLPALRGIELDPYEPVRAGLRPHRARNVCLERTPGTGIVHNFGHGGSGVTLSWGCAEEVHHLLTQHWRQVAAGGPAGLGQGIGDPGRLSWSSRGSSVGLPTEQNPAHQGCGSSRR